MKFQTGPGAMRRFLGAFLLSGLVLLNLPVPAKAAAVVGEAAPSLRLKDVHGKVVSLSDFRGKPVVIEWTNPNCPFVQKHYHSGNIPALQARYLRQGVNWLVIDSTHPSHQDYLEPAKLAERFREMKGTASALLLDEEGKAGRQWGAKTTPHLFIVDATGRLVYAGGIDDKRSSNPEDIKYARNYVASALDEIRAGRPVTDNNTRPYGCSIKY